MNMGELRSEWFVVCPQRRSVNRWYLACDLPPAIYWRIDYQGNDLSQPYGSGTVLELIERVAQDDMLDYYGLLYGRNCQIRVLRRVQLDRNDGYRELYQSPLYQQMRARGELQEIPALTHYIQLQRDAGSMTSFVESEEQL